MLGRIRKSENNFQSKLEARNPFNTQLLNNRSLFAYTFLNFFPADCGMHLILET